tara:strand:+ start:899 stop:1990 length:1092 start_codon:yes stop_codon:yes gene_type:complete
MKKLLIILLFIPLILFSQDGSESISNKTPDDYTGAESSHYHSGQVQSWMPYKEGKRDGLWKTYYENGQLEYQKNYKDGKLDGLYETYFEDGRLRYKAYHKNDELDGIVMQYNGAGLLWEKKNYKDGKLDGLYEYYKNGEISQRINYKNNTPYFIDGVFKLINDANAVSTIVTYKDGKLDGLYEMYSKNGQLKHKSNYKDGKLDGLYESYWENGRLSAKILYENGVLTTNLFFTIGEIDIRDVNFYDLEPMIKLFLKDCEENNIKLSSDYKITSTFETLDKGKVALSYGIFNDKEIIIKVSPQEWSKASNSKRWYILYHELGHDVLNLKHGQGGKMMFNFTEEDYTWDDFFKDKYYMFNSIKRE